LTTTPYKPSTNQVERFHRTMNSVLANTVAEHQKYWYIRLPFVMAAYRASRHDATGFSPNFLVLGREARAPPDIVYGSPNEELDETYDSFVKRMRERSVAAFAVVRFSLKRSAERNKRYYDLGVKAKRCHVGGTSRERSVLQSAKAPWKADEVDSSIQRTVSGCESSFDCYSGHSTVSKG